MKENLEVICIGMAVVDILVEGVSQINMKGQTEFVENIQMKPGGDAMNESITLANLEHNTGIMTLIGEDGQGEFLRESCKEQGVITTGIAVSKHYPTSISIALIKRNGERSFLSSNRGTVHEYSIDDMDLNFIKKGIKVVSIASLFCSKRLNEAEILAILKRAKKVGAITIADLVLNRADCKLEDLKKAMPYLDYIVPSEEEAKYFTKKERLEDMVQIFRSYGIENVVIKLGAKGVYASTPKETLEMPTYATKIVDTTGAGDNFMAGFISGLIRGCGLEDCLKFGSATSAISIGSVGATGSIQNRKQVTRFICNRDATLNDK